MLHLRLVEPPGEWAAGGASGRAGRTASSTGGAGRRHRRVSNSAGKPAVCGSSPADGEGGREENTSS
eukprot:13495152-Alexandrium_andersonii.AAC.1